MTYCSNIAICVGNWRDDSLIFEKRMLKLNYSNWSILNRRKNLYLSIDILISIRAVLKIMGLLIRFLRKFMSDKHSYDNKCLSLKRSNCFLWIIYNFYYVTFTNKNIWDDKQHNFIWHAFRIYGKLKGHLAIIWPLRIEKVHWEATICKCSKHQAKYVQSWTDVHRTV
jgi:hypothetical protein